MPAVEPVENVPTDESEASIVAEEDPTEQHEPAQEEDSPLPQFDTFDCLLSANATELGMNG